MKRLLAVIALIGLTISASEAQSTSLQVTNHLTVPQWVNPSTPGELTGRVILPSTDGSIEPVADAVVVMTDREGVTLRAKTNESGKFVVSGVEPGVYALTARAKGVFACCAMHVVDESMASANVLPGSVEVAAAGIDYTVIKSSILRYLPPAGKDSGLTIADADLQGISARVVGESLFRVMQTDGGLKGRIHVAGAEGKQLGDAGLLNIFLVHQGEVIDRVVSKRNGTFEFSDVPAGEYSILALGQAGLGMAGFELVDESLTSRVSRNALDGGANRETQSRTLVANFNDVCCCEEFSMQIAPLPQAIVAVEEVCCEEGIIVEEGIIGEDVLAVDEFGNPIGGVDQFGNPIGGFDQFGNPIGEGAGLGGQGVGASGGALGGGGFAGGGGAGAGGGGFGGGLSGLAGLAGLAAIAGTSDNNNGGNLAPPPPASPAR